MIHFLRHQARHFVALLLLFFTLLLPLTAGAEPMSGRQLHFERINEVHGLANKTITCGLQDRYGFLWFGSEDGLIRFDGYTFSEYSFDPADPHSLSSNLVYALAEDGQGQLWIGTVGGGLNGYDRKTDRFIHYRHDPSDPESLSHNSVVSLLADSTGSLWIGTEGGGLNRRDQKTGRFTRYRHDPETPESLANDTIWHIYEDHGGRIWVGTFGGGLDLYLQDSEGFVHYRHNEQDPQSLSSDIIGAIYQDQQGTMWIGTVNAGLNRFDPATGKAVRYSRTPQTPSYIPHNHIWMIHEDDGQLWLTSFGGGLILFDPATERFASYRHNPSVASSLSNDLVWFIMETRDDIIWIGTDGGGLNKLVKRAKAFNHLLTDPTQPFSLRYNGITAAAAGEGDRLWLANDGSGFQSLDLTSGSATNYRHQPSNSNSVISDLAEAILVDHQGMVWVGTYQGLSAFNPRSGSFTHYLHDPDNENSLTDNRIWNLMEDSSGTLWVATRDGLNALSKDRSRIIRFRNNPEDPASLSDNGIWITFEDSDGTIWIGTDNGLNRQRADGGFDRFLSRDDDPATLSHSNVTAIYEDHGGTLWVGTNGGLNQLLDHNSGRFRRFTVNDGLSSNSIRGILEDERDILWISTVKGLTRFDPAVGTCENFDHSDGLQGTEFSRAHLRLADGRMVLGGRNGINIFTPREISRNRHIPPVWLTEVRFQDGTSVRPDLPFPAPISLGYQDNDIRFEFTALDFSNPQNNSYAYMLEGFDSDWHKVGNQRNASYTNLDGGSYTFRVKGSNNHGLWNEDGTQIQLVVATPPWKRWWAMLLYILLVFLSVTGLVTLRGRHHKRRLASAERFAKKLQREIQEKEKAEAELQVSERRLSIALEASHQGIWEFSPLLGTTYYSPTWFTMLGYVPDQFPHTYETWLSLIHPEDRDRCEAYVQQFLREKRDLLQLEYRLRTNDGGFKWIQGIGKTIARDEGGNISHMCGLHLDITEAKESRRLIESSEQRYRELFDEAPIMYVIVENRGGSAWIRDANNTFLATLGYRREEVVNTKLIDYYGEKSREIATANNQFRQIITREFQPEERQLVCRDGRVIDCLLHASPELEEDGQASGIRAMYLDISQRKRAEEDNKRLESALNQAQKMEAIGTLAGGIAHDFNNILAAIIGYCDLLLLELKEDSPAHSKVRQICLAGARARDLIQQILTFSRKNERRLEPLQAAPVVQEALKLLRSTLPATISITENIGTNLPAIIADPTQLHQIVINLCTNSAQAISDGGRIDVTLDAIDLSHDNLQHLPQLHPGRHLRLVIADTGYGIDAEKLSSIFTPYFTTKTKTKGTGLGLAVVHGIVRDYQGAIEVTSTPGEGTTFVVLIPATDSAPMPAEMHAEEQTVHGNGEHILFVDDEPMLVDICIQTLTAIGYQVTGLTSCREALTLFSTNPDRFDLLITDMTMPEMTGDRLAGNARAIRPDLPVILLTGFSEKIQGQSPQQLNADTILFKPIGKTNLAQAIHSLLQNA